MNEPIEINANSKNLVRGFCKFTPNEHKITIDKIVEAMKKAKLTDEQIQQVLQEIKK